MNNNLVNMAQAPEKNSEAKTTISPDTIAEPTQPSYPYGLELSLDQDGLKKLGIDISTLNIDDVANLMAKVKVTRISINQGSDGSESQNLSLQITDMFLTEEEPQDFASSFDEATAMNKEGKTSGGFAKAV